MALHYIILHYITLHYISSHCIETRTVIFQECFSELRKLRDFLELKVTDDLLTEIADSCSIGNMRESKPKQMKSSIVAYFKKMTHPGYSVMRKGLFL